MNKTMERNTKKSIERFLYNMLGSWEKTQLVVTFSIILMVILLSLVLKSPYTLGILILATLYAYVGISWNIVAGFAGQLLIAHIIFLALGAYTTVTLLNRFDVSPWIGLPIGGLVSALAGFIIALITLRYGLKMDYFALFTIALMVTLKTIFLKWDFVGGAVGMWIRLSEPSWGRMIFQDKHPYLYIATGLLIIGVLVQYQIYKSKMGKFFIAIREDEDAAASLGVNVSMYKTLALVIGAAMAGVGGGFYVMYVAFVEPPQVFDLGLNVEIVMASPIIGGLGSLVGPVIGAFLNKPLAELIRGYLSFEKGGITLIVYGMFLVLAILFMPRGLAGVLRDIYHKLREAIKAKN
jgi:branched-chain amino acid transport system permease protein